MGSSESDITYHINSKPYLASGSSDGKIESWDFMTRQLQYALEGHTHHLPFFDPERIISLQVEAVMKPSNFGN